MFSSGTAVPPDRNDLLNAEIKGKDARGKSVIEHLEKGESFFEPVTKLRLKTMGHMNKSVKVNNSQNRAVECKKQSDVITKLLVKKMSPLTWKS